MIRFTIKTLGCKVNQCDSQSLHEEFLRRGWREETSVSSRGPRLFVVNTCCVTHRADRKSRHALRQAARDKGRGGRLVVVGCYPGYKDQDICDIPGVDAVFTHEQRDDFWRWVDHLRAQAPRPRSSEGRFKGRTRALLKVQEGCDNSCAYCVVPLVRGPSKSLLFRQVLARAGRLVAAGHKEIVLTGVNLGAYRRSGSRRGLLDIIDALEDLPGLERLRLSSIEVQDVTEALIDRMRSSGRLCPHLHIPFQSGDDAVLRHMGKHMCVADVLRLAARVRARVPDASITCDVIVGYPTETPRAFKNTCRFLEEVVPLKTHIFSFSPRRGTRLDAMGLPALDARRVKERRARLGILSDRLARSYMERFIGRQMDVLMEEREGGWPEGTTRNFLRVAVRSRSCVAGSITPVQITHVSREGMKGRIVFQGKDFEPKEI